MKKLKTKEWEKEFDRKFRLTEQDNGTTTIEIINYGWSKLNFRASEKDLKSFISSLLSSQRSAIIEEVEEIVRKHNEIIKVRLEYCQEQNGRDACKNCGLNEEDDLIDLSTLKSEENNKEKI